MKRTRRFSSANLRVEPLEDRRMLAVGTYLRLDGSAFAGSNALAATPNTGVGRAPASTDDFEAISGATALATEEGSFAFAQSSESALICEPTGVAAVHAPFISASSIGQVTATGGGIARATLFGANAWANFTYVPDTGFNQNLVGAHHLYINASSLSVGNAIVRGAANVIQVNNDN